MKEAVLRPLGTFKEPIQGLTSIEGQLWVASSKTILNRLQENASGIYSSAEEIQHNLDSLSSLAWTGSEFMLSEGTTKAIYRIGQTGKTQSQYLDLMKLKSKITMKGFAEGATLADFVTPILQAEGTNVSAMTFNEGKLWITVQAGYSSLILAVDFQTKELINSFYARGTDPVGIAFETSSKRGWVLDGYDKELSQFDAEGNWTNAVAAVPIEKPLGLILDKEGNFIIADHATSKIYLLDKGEIKWSNTQS